MDCKTFAKISKLANDPQRLAELLFKKFELNKDCIVIFSDGIIVGAKQNNLHVLDANDENYQLMLQGHSKTITSLCQIAKCGVISGTMDKSLRMWDVSKRKCTQKLIGHTDTITAIAPLSEHLTVSKTKIKLVGKSEVYIWDTNNGQTLHRLKFKKTTADGLLRLSDTLFACDENYKTIHIIDAEGGTTLKSIDYPFTYPFDSFKYEPMYRKIVVLQSGYIAIQGAGGIQIWDSSFNKWLFHGDLVGRGIFATKSGEIVYTYKDRCEGEDVYADPDAYYIWDVNIDLARFSSSAPHDFVVLPHIIETRYNILKKKRSITKLLPKLQVNDNHLNLPD